MRLILLTFLLFSLFLVIHEDDWKDVAIKLLDIIYKTVMEYLVVFQDCFNKAFEGTLALINNLVSKYFTTFNSCFNYALTILNKMIENYLGILKILVKNMTGYPNSIVYMGGAIIIVYIIKNWQSHSNKELTKSF